MTLYELIAKPNNNAKGFLWDGTMESIRGHLSDEEMEACKPRLYGDETGPYVWLWTLHKWSEVRPGDWIVIRIWEGTGIEVYGIKAHVREARYDIGKEIPFDPTKE